MRLFLFDIDGTLTDTTAIDNACYLQAFEEILGVTLTSTDWSQFTHVTDPGLFYALFAMHCGRPARPSEHAGFKARFVSLIEAATRDPKDFRAVDGAVDFVEKHCPDRGIAVAFATGGYGETARMKLQAAGFSDPAAVAHADPCMTRVEIVREAMTRAAQTYATVAFDEVTAFGDGVWDARVARELGLHFVGVDLHGDGRLRIYGCKTVISDFVEAQRVF